MSTKSKIDHRGLRERLASGKLTKKDTATLDELVVFSMELSKAVSSAKEKVGGKSVIARLPFGVDIVK